MTGGGPPTDPMEAKILLALVSALIGWGLKAAWDAFQLHRRMGRLSPVVVAQIQSAAQIGSKALTPAHLPMVSGKLEDARRSVLELILSGNRGTRWFEGFERINAVLDAIQWVQVQPPDKKGDAVSAVNRLSTELTSWCTAQPQPPRVSR
jgi:hypothetical protein